MKKMAVTLTLTLGSLCAALAYSNGSHSRIEYLSDAAGEQLVGGACFAVPSGYDSCNASLKGCKYTKGEKPISTGAGSWKADTPLNCGVSECGTVPQSKACDT